MQLIPVVDLRQGLVVRAQGGDRARYRPLNDVPAASEPTAVVQDLVARHPFSVLYVADLDAITGTGENGRALRALRRCFPDLTLWVDAGFRDAESALRFRETGLGVPVLGSETLDDRDVVLRVARLVPDALLSLDFRGDTFVGPAGLLDAPDSWPARVVVMSLDHVGSGRGPDLARLRRLRAVAPDKRIFAAGGVRDARDLEAIEATGAAGVLFASALHENRLLPADLARWSS